MVFLKLKIKKIESDRGLSGGEMLIKLSGVKSQIILIGEYDAISAFCGLGG